jgi:type III pantothenate kinase
MYILGDIGNTETKIFLISINNRIIKKLILSTKDINHSKLYKLFVNFKIDYKKIKKILFCSVVPKSFNIIKKYFIKKN